MIYYSDIIFIDRHLSARRITKRKIKLCTVYCLFSDVVVFWFFFSFFYLAVNDGERATFSETCRPAISANLCCERGGGRGREKVLVHRSRNISITIYINLLI